MPSFADPRVVGNRETANAVDPPLPEGGEALAPRWDSGAADGGGISAARRLRVALYSHDTMGLGHIRRNQLVAHSLASSPLRPDILLISGTNEARHLVMPRGADRVVLPALYKGHDGAYRSRHLRLPLGELIALRQSIIDGALDAFQPDVFIVDNVPRGAAGELDEPLDRLRRQGRCRCVLGLRDVLDEPVAIQREWHERHNDRTIRRYYDAIWIYGDSEVYDTVREYSFASDIADMARYTGYLDQRVRLDYTRGHHVPGGFGGRPRQPFVLCTVGGGQDGERLADAFMSAQLPDPLEAVLLTGPHMPRSVYRRLKAAAAKRERIRVVDFLAEPAALLADADCVIAMAGYNTVSEIVSFGKRALVVPRVAPRKEQLVRARRMQELRILDMLHPDRVTPQALAKWVERKAGTTIARPRHVVDVSGLRRLPDFLKDLIETRRTTPVAMVA